MRFRRTPALLAPLLLVCLRGGATAAVGTTGGPLLQKTFGGRPSAMGEAYVAIADDAFGLSFNPAGLSQLERAQAAAQYTSDIVDQKLGHFALAMPLSRFSALGVGFSYLDAGTIQVFDSLGNPVRSASAETDQLLQVGYSLALSEFPIPINGSLHVGVGGKYLRSQILEEMNAQTFAADAGLLYNQPLLGAALGSFGLSLANIGPGLRYSGGKASGSESDPLPRTLRAGLSYQRPVLRGDHLSVSLEADRVFIEDTLTTAVGLEYLYHGLVALRFGYRTQPGPAPLSFGVGLLWKDMSLDYSMALMSVFGSVQRISLSYSFDVPWAEPKARPAHRSEGMLSRLIRRIDEAMQQGRYFDATESALRFVSLFPEAPEGQKYLDAVNAWNRSILNQGAQSERFYYARGHQAFYEQKWAEAAQWLEQAQGRETNNQEIRKYLEIARKKSAEIRELKQLRSAARINYLYQLASHAYYEEKAYDKALRILSEILEILPYEPALKLKQMVERAQQGPEAVKRPSKSIPEDVKRAEELFYQAIRKYTQGDLTGAMELFRTAQQLDPESLDIQATLRRAEEEWKASQRKGSGKP